MKTKCTQGELVFTRWGGKRRGAVRKPRGDRAMVPHVGRPRLARHHPVLVTLRVAPGLRSMRADAEHAAIQVALCRASTRGGFRVVEYTVQSNHLHLLVEAHSARELARGMTGLAVRLARALNQLWKRTGQVFPDRYHARALTTPRAVRNALVYLLQNGRKHGAWLARRPDPYSSGPSFDGWRDGKGVADQRARLLPCARVWLLTLGWRRHGLIALDDRPALAVRALDVPQLERATRPNVAHSSCRPAGTLCA
jgi:REP element-mobilizing transposase RayT